MNYKVAQSWQVVYQKLLSLRKSRNDGIIPVIENKLRYFPHVLFFAVGGVLAGTGCGGENSSGGLKTDATMIPQSIPTAQLSQTPMPHYEATLSAQSGETVTPTPNFDATLMAQVGGTIEARSPEELEILMDSLPDNLKRSAVSILMEQESGQNYLASGAIVDTDEETGITYGISAGHLGPTSPITSFKISQPHTGLELDIDSAEMGMTWMSPDGILVFAFRHQDAFRLGTLGEENVVTDFSSQSTEPLYTLGFPTTITPGSMDINYAQVFPNLHVLTGSEWINPRTGLNMYKTNTITSFGGSGTVAVTKAGGAVGMLLNSDGEESFLYPFDASWTTVVQSAIENLENR